MNGDKEILYNMISREVYNLIGNISPALRVFSDVISKYLIMYIDPYVDAFFMGTETLNTDVAKEYINKEVKNEKYRHIIDIWWANLFEDLNYISNRYDG